MSALTILAEECELLNDSKYRNYITQVEKALRSFENTSEWADLISALGKLNKVLLAHVKYPVIPKRVTIGKRLAQCLHPALPSGVHLKALETYDIIFKCIGTQRLAQDLFVYSAGLFPLLSHAAMNVKPVLLSIYERHFVALGKHIKPGLNGMLLGLLPGLEEGSEHYDRTNSLLEDLCKQANAEYFYTCLWECIRSCPSVRLPAITFLVSHFNKKKSMEDQLYMMGLNIDLLVEAVCSAVQDTVVLVQRVLLDFLLLAFPMHNSQLTKSDMSKIVKAVTNVLLRRDMSLNRRLYTWFLGNSGAGQVVMATEIAKKQQRSDSISTTSETDVSYFHLYSKDLLVQALKSKLANVDSDTSFLTGKISIFKPFRILMSLLDKPEIGPVILENVLLSVLRCLYKECKQLDIVQSAEVKASENRHMLNKRNRTEYEKASMTKAELIKTSNLLFSTFEPYFIWDYLARMFESSCLAMHSGKKLERTSSTAEMDIPPLKEFCTLVEFLLEVISLNCQLFIGETFLETQTEHLPELLRRITLSLAHHCDDIHDTDIKSTLQLCSKLLSKVQPSMKVIEMKEEEDDAFPMDDLSLKDFQYQTDENTQDKHNSTNNTKINETRIKSDENDNLKANQSEEEQRANDVQLNGDVADYLQKSEEFLRNSVPRSVSNSSISKRISGPINLMQNCVECFQMFFNTFATCKILKSESLSNKCVQSLTLPQYSRKSSSSDSLLYDCSKNSKDEDSKGNQSETVTQLNLDLTDDTIETYTCACKLLLEFSSFPIYCTDFHKMLYKTCSQDESYHLPPWLQDLMTCACFVNNFSIQSSSISAMLDLIILTQSVQSASDSSEGSKLYCEGMVSVLILPALPPVHLKFIDEKTCFYKRIAEILWDYLAEDRQRYHQRSVELFNLLHQVAPSSWTCEDVIGQSMVSSDEKRRISAFKKFTILWHITRDIRSDMTPGHSPRTFDRSMFVLLDSLKEDTSATKTITSQWLTHIVQRNDISRVFVPLLSMLLHPDTARVSVQHVNFHKPKKIKLSESNEVDNSEAQIYAISSEGGNIIYHVNTDGKKLSGKSAENLKSLSMVMSDRGMTTIAPSDHDFSFDKVRPDDLNLRLNPFGSESSLDSRESFDATPTQSYDINSFKRLDKNTCAKEGIVFDGSDTPPEPPPSEPVSEETDPEDLVSGILDELLFVASDSGEGSSAQKDEDDKQRENTLSRESSVDQDMNNIEGSGMDIDSPTGSELDLAGKGQGDFSEASSEIHNLHMHLLLYTQKFDYKRTMYALTTIKSMLLTCPRLVVTAMVTTSISNIRTQQLAKLQSLLARHRKSVFGKNFFGTLPADTLSSYRSNMFIEVVISVCLYFIRSYYPNFTMSKLSQEELNGNKEVHILACEVLTLLMSELITIMRESGKSFMSYIKDLLTRCKVQKALLHCTLASVYNARKRSSSENTHKISETIIAFNEENLDSSANETFQIRVLNLLLVLIMLENRISKIQGEPDSSKISDWERSKIVFHSSLTSAKYAHTLPIVQQGMFVSCILSAFKQPHMCHMHKQWIAMVTSSLPYMGRALSSIVMCVVSQLCRNIEALAAAYETSHRTKLERIPPDHAVSMLEGLTTVCHYCLLDSASPVSVGLPAPTSNTITTDSASAGQILTNLIHVFNPSGNNRDVSPQRDLGPKAPIMEARRSLLSILPRIIACMTALWKASDSAEKSKTNQQKYIIGSPKVIKQQIIAFLSPISVPHGNNLLGAVAVTWNDYRKKPVLGMSKKMQLASLPSDEQLLLVNLISAIKVLPTDTLVQTVKQVIKQPPPSELSKAKKTASLEVNMLQFFYAYVQQAAGTQLLDSWTSLSSLLRDTLQLNITPYGKFLLLQIFNEFVQKTPIIEEKKYVKELQDITQKLLEAIGTIGGSSLEQTTWLRRNLAVKPGPQTDRLEDEETSELDEDVEVIQERKVVDPKLTNTSDSKYSVQALSLLAELIAGLLDVVYTSEDKDRVPTVLTPIMYNVFPYLKSHSTHNLPSYRACSQMLASLSGYQYTRKAWRKEAFELLMDPYFFQLDMRCIHYWRCIIDNLMTHDKTTFKDLMNRVTITQTGSISIFSSKEQELEQRAGMMKRLAFTIFCSEPDQYQKAMPEIQERLAECLRSTHQVPSIMAQVFLCFRVLILRMSPHQLTSLWPTVITEMIHVFMQIEQELSNDTDEFNVFLRGQSRSSDDGTQVQRIANLDSSWAHLGNGLNAHNNPAWLQLYLSVCKLLDLALALPADVVPQFQLYRWAFIGGVAAGNRGDDEDPEEDEKEKKRKKKREPKFVPHIIRLTKLVNDRVKGATPIVKTTPGRPILNITYLRSLVELQPFFNTLCHSSQSDGLVNKQSGKRSKVTVDKLPKSKSAPFLNQFERQFSDLSLQFTSDRQYIEELIECDFLEPLPA
ncbi:protein DOP1A-like isoform X1 [Mytilus galloprovincialis]|uniref:protein DOP1A-like isoform X1 n=1 Tax=Mytilus galloprovincialis TaxID=29158 RepID=UPI003F7C0350